MFTGIVEATGVVRDLVSTAAGHRLRIETALAPRLIPGDSLAVDGVCLTATVIEGSEVAADIGPETARVTTLGALRRDQRVNLERPMRLDGRLGGHLVLGHVDGVGVIDAVRRDADSHWLTVRFPAALAPYFIHKGSVAVDGISLTVARLADEHFEVQVIPFTWEHTTLGERQVGDTVNLECDMIGKYVVRLFDLRARDGGAGKR